MASGISAGASAGAAKAVQRVENGGAVACQPAKQHHRKQRVKQADGEVEFGRGEIRGKERECNLGQESHCSRSGDEKQRQTRHRLREKLLRPCVALLNANPDKRGNQRLVHRLRKKIDEQIRNQESDEKSVHRIGSP